MLIDFSYLFRKYNIKAPGVVHLGAHYGEEAEAYTAQGIDKVIWVEAIPSVFARLVRHTARYPNHLAINACLHELDQQTVQFNIASNEGQSSSYLEFGTHSKEHPSVKFIDRMEMVTTRFDTLMCSTRVPWVDRGFHGWFLNIDLQGAELLALKGMGNLLTQFGHAYIEVNERQLYRGCALVGEIDDYLSQFGFVGIETKMTGAGWGDKYYQKIANISER